MEPVEVLDIKEYLVRMDRIRENKAGKEVVTWNWEVKIANNNGSCLGMAFERELEISIPWMKLERNGNDLLEEMKQICNEKMNR